MKKTLGSLIIVISLILTNDVIHGTEHKQIADEYFFSGNYSSANDYYQKVLSIDEDNAEVNYRVGLCLFLIGKFKESSPFWKKAKKINPSIFKGRTYQISSKTMIPTLQVGEYVIIEPEYYKHNAITRGDVVAYSIPEIKKRYINRIIGIPGDQIEIKNKVVYINGSQIEDPTAYHSDKEINDTVRDNLPLEKVPKGKYFFLGDNRDNSLDSRYYSSIKGSQILGKVLVIYYSALKHQGKTTINPERIGLIVE
ncbi:MAG: signal peptidase I [Proteobacteria bacterium]|nr:signal peptidase I [Pseudomonadota bacterium]